MADFKCEPGRVLTRAETEAMLNYDEAGVARPAEYQDVVFDATGIQGAVYRCKTSQEKEADKVQAAELKRLNERQEAIDAIKLAERERIASDMGVDPASLPIDLNPAATFNADTNQPASTTGGANQDADGKNAKGAKDK